VILSVIPIAIGTVESVVNMWFWFNH